MWWLVFRFLPGRRSDDSGAYEPDAETGIGEGAVDQKSTRRLGRLMAIALVIGFSAFPVLVLAAAANSRLVAKVGLSLPMVPFLVLGSILMVGAFTGRRKTFRTRLGLVGLGLLIVGPATYAVLGVWSG